MSTPSFDSIEAQASYGIGLQVGQQLNESGLEGLQPEALLAGLRDAMEGNAPAVPVEAVHRALREIHERADAVRREQQKGLAEAGQKFLEENAKNDDVTVTESGLQFKVLEKVKGLFQLVRIRFASTIPVVWLMAPYLIAPLNVASQLNSQ